MFLHAYACEGNSFALLVCVLCAVRIFLCMYSTFMHTWVYVHVFEHQGKRNEWSEAKISKVMHVHVTQTSLLLCCYVILEDPIRVFSKQMRYITPASDYEKEHAS